MPGCYIKDQQQVICAGSAGIGQTRNFHKHYSPLGKMSFLRHEGNLWKVGAVVIAVASSPFMSDHFQEGCHQ